MNELEMENIIWYLFSQNISHLFHKPELPKSFETLCMFCMHFLIDNFLIGNKRADVQSAYSLTFSLVKPCHHLPFQICQTSISSLFHCN